MNKLIIPLIALTFLFTGCEEQVGTMIVNSNNGAVVGFDEASLISFDAFLSNCSVVQVNNTNASNVCGGKFNVFTTYNNGNFNVSCCDLNSDCKAESNTNFSGLCNYDVNNGVSFQSIYSGGEWLNMCCDTFSNKCYFLNDLDITNTSCPLHYNLVTIGVNYNETSWNARCCNYGGLEAQ